jgi:hypothetical protein
MAAVRHARFVDFVAARGIASQHHLRRCSAWDNAAHAVESTFGSLARDKPVQAPLTPFEDFVELIGFGEVWAFQRTYAPLQPD